MVGGTGIAWLYRSLYGDLLGVAKESIDLQNLKYDLAVQAKASAERRVAELEAQQLAATKAIEAGSLPWFPKNDKLEARFEADAIDRLDNPVVSWDTVPGLGGTN